MQFEKLTLYRSVSQSEATFIVYSKPIESGHIKKFFFRNWLFERVHVVRAYALLQQLKPLILL